MPTDDWRWPSSAVDISKIKAPDDADVALGAAIRQRRQQIGISQEELGRRCGVSFQQMQKYERGINRISFSRLAQIAAALGCTLQSIIADADCAPPPAAAGGEIYAGLELDGARELLLLYNKLPVDAQAAFLALVKALI